MKYLQKTFSTSANSDSFRKNWDKIFKDNEDFKTHDNCDIDVNGTYLLERIDISYAELIGAFGQPKQEICDKTDACWAIQFSDGTIATIYNYKNGKNYLGSRGMDVENITQWYIGGHNKKAFELVKNVLKKD